MYLPPEFSKSIVFNFSSKISNTVSFHYHFIDFSLLGRVYLNRNRVILFPIKINYEVRYLS